MGLLATQSLRDMFQLALPVLEKILDVYKRQYNARVAIIACSARTWQYTSTWRWMADRLASRILSFWANRVRSE